jgi:hypothetical protein
MYWRESEVLDSRSWRRLVTVLKKDSWTVGEAEGGAETELVLLRDVVAVAVADDDEPSAGSVRVSDCLWVGGLAVPLLPDLGGDEGEEEGPTLVDWP